MTKLQSIDVFDINIPMDSKNQQDMNDKEMAGGSKFPARKDDPILDTFLKRIEPLLAEKKLTRSGLAERIGISRNAVSQFFLKERRPSTAILIKIANELSTTIDYLVGRSEQAEIEDLLQHVRVSELVHGFVKLSHPEQESVLNYLTAVLQAKNVMEAKNRPPGTLHPDK